MKKIYLMAVIFAIIAGAATWLFATEIQKSTTIKDVEKASVVVPVADINEYTVITDDMLAVVDLPVSSITYGTVTKKEDIVGLVNKTKLYRGEQIVADKLTLIGENSDDSRLSYHLNKGEYAVAVVVSNEYGIAGFIREGDYINLYAIEKQTNTAKLALKNLLVLKAGSAAEMREAEASDNKTVIDYTVLVLRMNEANLQTYYGEIAAGSSFNCCLVPFSEGNKLNGQLNETVTKHEIATNPYSPVQVTVAEEKED